MKLKLNSDEGHYKLVVTSILQMDRSDKKLVLEVGAGPKMIEKFLPKHWTYHTMDTAEEFWGEKYTYIHNLDAGKFPIKDNTYDIVICHETLEHVMYPEKVIKEIIRVAKPDACFYFSLPNEYNFLARIYYFIGKKTAIEEPFKVVEKNLHIHRPRVIDIQNLFSHYFIIKKIDYCWQSRASEHSPLARSVDKVINALAAVHPTVFARTVSVECRNKR